MVTLFRTPFVIRLFKLLLFFLCFFVIDRFCHRQTGGFALTKIHSDRPFNPEWEVAPPTPAEEAEIERALSQPYRFFSYGGQSYVFLSEDGKTVLKFFKHHHMRPIPLFREDKLPSFFTSCTLAYRYFKERTALLALHLNKTTHLNKTVTLIDKLNIAHQIDLDRVDFALQRRAELPYRRFLRLKKEKNLEAAEKSLHSLLELIALRCQKGIYDRDPNIRRNCGFLGDNAIELDLGSYTYDPLVATPAATREILVAQTRKLKHWIQKSYPELLPYFEMQLSAMLEKNTETF
ncbi:MAG: hypothetical protein K2P51_07160 [Rhabdochlamydiaceae bacterium]|nr:hypothetical protein [Rhabdochlamydiaceae bacterium]